MKRDIFLHVVFLCVLSFCAITLACKSDRSFSDMLLGKNTKEDLYAEYVHIGDTYLSLEKYNEAISYYERALKSKTMHYDVLYKMGRANALAKHWTEAESIYKSLLERDSKNFSIRSSLAYIYAMSGDINSALTMYKSLAEDFPSDKDILENYITVLFSVENAETAEPLVARLEENFPESEHLDKFKKKLEELLPSAKNADSKSEDEANETTEKAETAD